MFLVGVQGIILSLPNSSFSKCNCNLYDTPLDLVSRLDNAPRLKRRKNPQNLNFLFNQMHCYQNMSERLLRRSLLIAMTHPRCLYKRTPTFELRTRMRTNQNLLKFFSQSQIALTQCYSQIHICLNHPCRSYVRS